MHYRYRLQIKDCMAISMTTSLDFFRMENYKKNQSFASIRNSQVQHNIFYICTFCCSQNMNLSKHGVHGAHHTGMGATSGRDRDSCCVSRGYLRVWRASLYGCTVRSLFFIGLSLVSALPFGAAGRR